MPALVGHKQVDETIPIDIFRGYIIRSTEPGIMTWFKEHAWYKGILKLDRNTANQRVVVRDGKVRYAIVIQIMNNYPVQ